MTHALWFVLLIWSLSSKRARPQGVLLFASWFWTYAVIFASQFHYLAFTQVVLIDFIIAPLSLWFALEHWRKPWGWFVAALHVVYIIQHFTFAVFWFDMAPMSRAIFTAQCLTVAWVATVDARRAIRRKRYVRARLAAGEKMPSYVERWSAIRARHWQT